MKMRILTGPVLRVAFLSASAMALMTAGPALAQVNASSPTSGGAYSQRASIYVVTNSSEGASVSQQIVAVGNGPPTFDKTGSLPAVSSDQLMFSSGGLDYHYKSSTGAETVHTSSTHAHGVVTINTALTTSNISDIIYTESSTQPETDDFILSVGSITENNSLRVSGYSKADVTGTVSLSIKGLSVNGPAGYLIQNKNYTVTTLNSIIYSKRELPFGADRITLNSGTLDVGQTLQGFGATQNILPLVLGFTNYNINNIPFSITIGIDDSIDSFVQGINVAPVPEPAIWVEMLVGVGLVGAALRGRRRIVAAA